jgi:hypothetical protein
MLSATALDTQRPRSKIAKPLLRRESVFQGTCDAVIQVKRSIPGNAQGLPRNAGEG